MERNTKPDNVSFLSDYKHKFVNPDYENTGTPLLERMRDTYQYCFESTQLELDQRKQLKRPLQKISGKTHE